MDGPVAVAPENLLDLLAAEPPAVLLALALRQVAADPGTACRMAALACALEAAALDLAAGRVHDEPAARLAVKLDEWLGKAPDKDLGIWSLHLAVVMTSPEDDPGRVTGAADWLLRWFTSGRTRRGVLG